LDSEHQVIELGLLRRPQMKALTFIELDVKEVVLGITIDDPVDVVVWTPKPFSPEA
jgi:hypothetical protein